MRRTRSAGRTRLPLRGLLPLALALVVWQLVGDPDSPYYPPPSTWWTALSQLQRDGVLLPALGQTMRTFFLALAIAIVVGAGAGAAVGASRASGRAVEPLFELMRTTPPPVIVPIAILIIGSTSTMMTAVVAFAALWPVLLNSAAAMRAVPAVRLEGARSLRLSRAERLFKVVLPSLTPGIMLGLSVAAPLALIVTLVVELLSASGGLGDLLLTAQRSFDAAGVFGLLAVAACVGLALNAVVGELERRMARNWGGAG